MKAIKFLIAMMAGAILISACSNPQADKKAEIEALENGLFSDETKMVDRAKANELIKLYVAYADEFPGDAENPEMLFKAGDMAMNLNQGRTAIEIFDRVMENYPDYEKTPQCLFLKGYIYENNLGNLEMARKIYEEFLQKYPEDKFADDAKISIQNLGKSPEELIKEFEAKAKAQEEV